MSFIYWKKIVSFLGLFCVVLLFLSSFSAVDAEKDQNISRYGKDKPYGLYLMGKVEGWSENFETPDWTKNAVFYQIMPAYFRNGCENNDPNTGDVGVMRGDVVYGVNGPARIQGLDWDESSMLDRKDPDYPGNLRDVDPWGLNWYGGDLQGVIEKADYLDNLGVNAIYFNPTFDSTQVHGYSVIDYKSVGRYYGAPPEREKIPRENGPIYKLDVPYEKSLEVFENMMEVLENHGIKVILDGVWDHTSAKHRWMDVDNEWPGTLGAYESKNSPYSDWYNFKGWPTTQPTVENTPGFRNYVFGEEDSIISFWDNYGVDGWRLDVPQGQPHSFWEGFRDNYKQINPSGYIVGEEWGDASPSLQGDEWDSTMNYRFKTAMKGFMYSGSVSDFDQNLRSIMTDYPPAAFYTSFNLIDSHDTDRTLWTLGYRKKEDREKAIKRLKLGVIFQMTYPGAPVVYYGDEIGMTGKLNTFNRSPFPWPDTNKDFIEVEGGRNMDFKPSWDLYKHYQELIRIRKKYPVLRTGTVETVKTDDSKGVYALARTKGIYGDSKENFEHKKALLVFNNSESESSTTINVSDYFDSATVLTDVLNNENVVVTPEGKVNVDIDGLWGKVLISDVVDLENKSFITSLSMEVPKSLEEGKSSQIVGKFMNIGNMAGSSIVNLFVDGNSVGEQTIQISPGETGDLKFEVSLGKGTHEVRIGNLVRTVKVRESGGRIGIRILAGAVVISLIIGTLLLWAFKK